VTSDIHAVYAVLTLIAADFTHTYPRLCLK